jgi:malonyl-CoA O-methyltransferase
MGGPLQRAAIARAFSRASGSYDAAARLQAVVRTELLSRLDGVSVAPAVVVDLGAGTGIATQQLKARYRKAQVLAVDIAPGMLAAVGRRSRFWRPLRRVAADAMSLPLRAQSVDLVFSSLMFQWCEEPDVAFAEVQRVLKPGGLFLFSSFGPDTLRELREAWAQVDRAVHVNAFIDMHDLGSALQRAGFAEPVLDVDRHVLHYADARALMRELKAIGAHNVNADRARTLTGPGRLKRMEAAYEARREPQGLPATYEVVYAAAWGAGTAPSRAAIAAETAVSLAAFTAAVRGPRA